MSLVDTTGPSARTLHFSVDDVIDELLEVADAGTPLLEQPMFAFLAQLNQQFGAKVDLYLFQYSSYKDIRRSLADVPTSLCHQLKSIPWLRFGPHALDYDTAPHAQTPEQRERIFDDIYSQIDRFAGPDKHSKWIRLHYFSEAYENIDFLRAKGVTSLLLTDKAEGAYRLPNDQREALLQNDSIDFSGLTLRRSHGRMENLPNASADGADTYRALDNLLRQHRNLVLFTHAVDLRRESVRATTMRCLAYMQKAGLEHV